MIHSVYQKDVNLKTEKVQHESRVKHRDEATRQTNFETVDNAR